MKRLGDKSLPALAPSSNFDERGIRTNSVTSQLRALVTQKPRKRRILSLEPIGANEGARNNAPPRDHVSVQKQIQGPVSLQWLVDDFVQAAGVGDIEKVDHYIRGGIPIDKKHSVLEETALHASAALQNDLVARRLVQAGADVDELTKNRESVLHLAARYHRFPVAEEMLRNRADLTVLNKQGILAMELAGEVGDDKMHQLLEPPPSPPSHVQATNVSSTTIMVEWSSHGVKSSVYQFRISWVLSGSFGESFEICCGSSFRINNLMPASTYEIRVQTGNLVIGWGISSDLLLVETDGDVPNAMAAPSFLRVSDRSITMQVRLPPNNGAEVQRVSIQLQCTGSISAVETSTFRKLLKSAEQDQRWESVICDAATMRSSEDNPTEKVHSVEGLLPGQVYYFRIKSLNRFGWSPDGEVSDGICTNDVPKIVAVGSRSMTLVWTKPCSTELISKYQVQARPSYSTKWDIVADEVFGQRADVCGLIPATAYSFRVVQHYASRSGWEDAETCACTQLCSTLPTVPEPPLELKVVDRTASSVLLSWETPRCNGYSLEVYQVDYRIFGADGSCWIRADSSVPVGSQSFNVGGLIRGKPYQLRMCARNLLGEGPFTELLDPVWTYAFLPPHAPSCVSRTSFSLTIAWEDGASLDELLPGVDAPRLVYEIQMYQANLSRPHNADDISSEEWVTVVARTADRQAQISGLRPLGNYCFRVRAQSSGSSSGDGDSVFSPISAVFQTLRRM